MTYNEKEPRLITVEVVSVEKYDGGWPAENLLGFIDWLSGKLKEIPTEYRAAATIEIGSEHAFEDDYYPTISISYKRLETPEDVIQRVASRLQRLYEEENKIKHRLAEIEREKAKG